MSSEDFPGANYFRFNIRDLPSIAVTQVTDQCDSTDCVRFLRTGKAQMNAAGARSTSRPTSGSRESPTSKGLQETSVAGKRRHTYGSKATVGGAKSVCRTGNFSSEYHALSSWLASACLNYAFPLEASERA
jgi:hypothetical protein